MEETQQVCVKRGKSFTNSQDVAICNAWLSVTQDPTLVNSQSSNTFWDRANDESARSRISIQSRFGKIMRSFNKFRGYLRHVQNVQQIEATKADKVLQAKLLYNQLENKKFTFDHCRVILQNSVKWQDSVTHKKQESANGSPRPYSPSEVPQTPVSLSSNRDPLEDDDDDDDDDDDVDDPNAKRPIGDNIEKESRKKHKVVVDTSSVRFCDLFSEFNRQACENKKRKALAQERKLKILEEANERERKRVEVELKILVERNEREQKEQDDKMMDISNMEPQSKAYFEHRKAEIFAKLKCSSSS